MEIAILVSLAAVLVGCWLWRTERQVETLSDRLADMERRQANMRRMTGR